MDALMRGMEIMQRGMEALGPGWQAWVGLLFIVNGVLSAFLWRQRAARWMLGATWAGAMVLMLMAGQLGFVRLLGIAHFGWFLVLPLLWRLAQDPSVRRIERAWAQASLVLSIASLSLDALDMIRYLSGERAPLG
jgi:hypothetical protein